MEQELKDLKFIRERLCNIRCKHILTRDRELFDEIADVICEIARMQGRLEAKIEIKKEG